MAEEERCSAGDGAAVEVEQELQEKRKKPLLVKRHIKYFERVLNCLPCSLAKLDSNRMTLAFFGLSGLDMLGALDTISAKRKQELINWIYAQQILPKEDGTMERCGFRGSCYIGIPYSENQEPTTCSPYDTSHVAMTYTALANLLILGDDLSRVNKVAVVAGIRRLQLPNGSFYSTAEGSENDMRFVYCAACVCYMLQDWSAMDAQKAADFIKSSQGYDSGIGQGPSLESHGGSTFCGIAALTLMGKLEATFSPSQLEGLRKWCIFRQQTGFQGRPNKAVDTCYSFWIGASLQLLGSIQLVEKEWNRRYVLSTQEEYGGLSKWPDYTPDPLHTYLGLCGLSLNGEEGLAPVHAALNISQRAAQWLDKIHANS